jgi:hypothetical protein
MFSGGASTTPPASQEVIELVVQGVQRDSSPCTLEALAERQMDAPVLEARISALVAIMKNPCTLASVGIAKGECAMLAALTGHRANARVCAQACLALDVMSKVGTLRASIRRLRGVHVALEVLDKHRQDPGVQTHALALLERLVAGSKSTHAVFRKSRGPALLGDGHRPAFSCENAVVARRILLECSH